MYCLHSALESDSCERLPRDCRYFDPETVGLDFEGMCSDIESAPEGSIIVLHGKPKHTLIVEAFQFAHFVCVLTAGIWVQCRYL